MNRNRRTVFFRIMATIMCAVCVVVMCSGYQVRAETRVLSAYNLRELNSSIEQAKEGDVIQIRGEIDISSDLKIPKEQITIQRTSEKDRLVTSMGIETHFQNIIFDGGGIKSTYPILIVQDNSTIENCIFRNCGDPNFSGGVGSIGGAVQLNNGNVIFRECDFAENRAYVGGHVLIGENVVASFFGCTMKNGYACSGGAISVAANASCFLEGCTITENSSMDYGGGIANGGYIEICKTKLFNNTTINGGADIATKIGGTTLLGDSLETLQELFESENILVHGWICDYNFDEGLFIPDVEPTTENLLKLDFEYKQPDPEQPEQPTNPDETEKPTEPENPDNPDTPTEPENPENPDQPDTPTEPGENEPPKDESGIGTDKPAEDENKPSEPETPPDDTQNKGDEQPPTDNPEEKPGVSGSGNAPATPSDSTGNNGGNNTGNSTSTTTTSDNRTTDNSDNSRYSSTSDSNNTSTVNNYYQQEKQPSSSGESVQTIVVPVGNTGNGEPLQQTIRVESPEGTTATGSLEGLTLNINVNTASPDQAANTSPVQQSGISWYQAIVLCLLSAILVCLLKRR